MDIDKLISFFLGWPMIGFVLAVGVLCSIALNFVQIKNLFSMWRYTLFPDKKTQAADGDMTPVQAFITTLSASLGNGSIAGMATALYAGGPGAALWVVIIGFILMAVRFSEVYLSVFYAGKQSVKGSLGGPMLYLREVVGGARLAFIYGVCAFVFSLIGGNATQTNSIALSLQQTWGIAPMVTAAIMFVFILYVVLGGAKRVAFVSEAIVPIKVVVFFVSSFIVLAYHYAAIIPALRLIVTSAFSPVAVAGGVVGFSVQQAMRFGIARGVFATEAGLGTAAIMFGSTGSTTPVKDAIMSMLSTFISVSVCLLISVCIVASGVWDSGLNSTALTVASFQTVFGAAGGWVVSFLSVSFGIGVLVAYAYVAREAWLFITGGRFVMVYNILYCMVAFGGAIAPVEKVWTANDLIMAVMLLINLCGLVYLMPVIKKGLAKFYGHTA